MPDETATASTEASILGPGAYDELVEQYKWTYALVTILLEHYGNGNPRVEITRELLETHTFASRLSVTRNDEYGTYIIEVVRD